MRLITSKRYSDDSRLLLEAARQQGWDTLRLQSNTVPPEALGAACCVYAEGFLAEHLADQLGIHLLRPANDALARLSRALTARAITFCTAAEFQPLTRPMFVKPADQKLFAAAVYRPGEDIPGLETLLPDDPILISEVVHFTREYRFFVRDSTVRTGSIYWHGDRVPMVDVGYEGAGDALWDQAAAFAQAVCAAHPLLPRSYVLDVGQLDSGVWAVIEFNPVWASGIYGCSPSAVLDCLAVASTTRPAPGP
ncbi:ATP-grasp domain-containing protein [Deinococcus sonorensis]|uniref:ATP-grasp domain-containing protein n=2 Tax=Deinococcus sonorensis TaxID=309891 RepID=A0AAU7UH16_9DEIO